MHASSCCFSKMTGFHFCPTNVMFFEQQTATKTKIANYSSWPPPCIDRSATPRDISSKLNLIPPLSLFEDLEVLTETRSVKMATPGGQTAKAKDIFSGLSYSKFL